ncbi:hypothetical protein GW916_14895 [bacterium]|nr:hypothetical protein [bacterium]
MGSLLISISWSSQSAYAAERWSPYDLNLATQTALSDFREYYYDFETWKQIRSYYVINTPYGAQVKITYNQNERLISTDFTCRYLLDHNQKRMSCREH